MWRVCNVSAFGAIASSRQSLEGIMQFVIHYTDRKQSGDIRQRLRTEHLEYRRGFLPKLLLAGPILAEDGETFVGSLIIVESTSRQEAEDIARGDPYVSAGLFETITIMPYRVMLARFPNPT